jgi:hypothetical protein
MTCIEYGKLLVTMDKHSGSELWLPNLQSKMILENIPVTLEFLLDNYNGLLEFKEKYSNDSTVSFVFIIYYIMSQSYYFSYTLTTIILILIIIIIIR